MGAKACTCSGRIGLDGIALVKQTLVIELLEEPPQGLYILVVVGDVGVVEVNEIAHLLGELTPFGRKHHHVLTTFLVIIFCRNILVRSLVVNILLCYAKLFLHTKLHGQTVSVPACLAVNLESLHGLVAVERVLDASSQHMVNAGMSIG